MVKCYRKKATQPMFRWHPDLDITSVSISEADKRNGSPKFGDMIAYNPDDDTDMWLVAEKYFNDHYEEVSDE